MAIFDLGDEDGSESPEVEARACAEIMESAIATYHRDRRLAAISVGSLVAWLVLVAQFLAGHPLYRYWETVGKYLMIATCVPFFASLMDVPALFFSWKLIRDLREIDREVK